MLLELDNGNVVQLSQSNLERFEEYDLIWLDDEDEGLYKVADLGLIYEGEHMLLSHLEILTDWLDKLKTIEANSQRPKAGKPVGWLDDTDALDLIHFCLSAPDWSVSFLEDIAAIVKRTGRVEVKGATWAKH